MQWQFSVLFSDLQRGFWMSLISGHIYFLYDPFKRLYFCNLTLIKCILHTGVGPDSTEEVPCPCGTWSLLGRQMIVSLCLQLWKYCTRVRGMLTVFSELHTLGWALQMKERERRQGWDLWMPTWKVLDPANQVLDDTGLKKIQANSGVQVNTNLTSRSICWNGWFLLFIEKPDDLKFIVYKISISLQPSSLPDTQQTYPGLKLVRP